MQTKAVIYCRVSSERQVNEGHGLDSQEKRCRTYAESKEYSVIRVFHDEGISGGLFDRPAMKELISFLDRQPLEHFVIIFDDLARFARDVAVHLNLKTELEGRGAKLECPNFNFDTSPEGEFAELVIASSNQLARKQNRRQVIQKMKARLESGYWPFCMPPGLKNVKGDNGKVLTPNGSPEAIVRKAAIEKFISRELELLEEVQQFVIGSLKEMGIKSKLSLHGTKNLLTNPLYFGLLEYKPWDIPLMRAKHNGLVPPELYQEVLSRFSGKPKPRLRKDYSEDFPLRGLVKCSECGGPFTGSWNTGRSKRYAHYTCKKFGCSVRWKTTGKERLENDFVALLQGVSPSDGMSELAIDVLKDVWDLKTRLAETAKTEKLTQISETERKVNSYKERITKCADEEMIKMYETEIKDLLVKRKELETEDLGLNFTNEEFGTALQLVIGTLKEPVKMWLSPDHHDRRTIAMMYFDEPLRYNLDKGFGTVVLASPIRLMQELSQPSGQHVEMEGVSPRMVKVILGVYKRS